MSGNVHGISAKDRAGARKIPQKPRKTSRNPSKALVTIVTRVQCPGNIETRGKQVEGR